MPRLPKVDKTGKDCANGRCRTQGSWDKVRLCERWGWYGRGNGCAVVVVVVVAAGCVDDCVGWDAARGVEGAELLAFAPLFPFSFVVTVDTAAKTTDDGTRDEVGDEGESTIGRIQRGSRCNVVVPRFCGIKAAAWV